MQVTQVQSLVRELRSRMAKKKKKKAGSFFGEINEMTGTNPQRKLVGCSGGLEPVVVNCLVSELIVS